MQASTPLYATLNSSRMKGLPRARLSFRWPVILHTLEPPRLVGEGRGNAQAVASTAVRSLGASSHSSSQARRVVPGIPPQRAVPCPPHTPYSCL